ncbi:MAG: hypothetical protein HOW73_40555 [Polyangiaceae bacterium]|nr:hypothetical protein [Polyangiaceae bacterium]
MTGFRSWAAFVAGLMLVATGAAGFAIAFRMLLGAAIGGLFGASDIVAAMHRLPIIARVIVPALGGLFAGGIGLLIARSASGHGVGDVMEAVVLGRVRLSMRVTLLKSAASWIAILCGGSIGREGPLIQFGGSLGKEIASRLHLTSKQARVLIAAGTAAGFAAAYNTPFAAVLFVLEIVSGVVTLDALIPVSVATVVATMITRTVVGEGPIYGARAFSLASPLELVGYALLGLLAALVAQGFMRMLTIVERWLRHPKLRLPLRAGVGGLAAGSVVALLPEVAGNGYEPLNELLDGRFTFGFVLLLLIGKCLATTASVASGSPGGVFTPTLLIGGALGMSFGHAANVFGLSASSPGSFALVGMAAATAATTHAPLLAAVMVFELSTDYAIVLPLLLATSIAAAISRALREDSIYTKELRERGVRWKLTLEGRRIVD